MVEDDELAAMTTIASALNPLDAAARIRALKWAFSRFGDHDESNPGLKSEPPHTLDQGGETENARPPFETFADLFSVGNPRTESEKALLAAYWVQIGKGQSSFPAQLLNSELKDLGHGIGNITDALTALKNERPALALQLKKSGTSRQARKTYKLTQEGIRRVKSMLTLSE